MRKYVAKIVETEDDIQLYSKTVHGHIFECQIYKGENIVDYVEDIDDPRAIDLSNFKVYKKKYDSFDAMMKDVYDHFDFTKIYRKGRGV